MKRLCIPITFFLIFGIFSGCTKSLEENNLTSEFIITQEDREDFIAEIDREALGVWGCTSDIIEFDVTEDGYPDLCVGITQGSGIVSDSIIIYDVYNQNIYKLDDRMKYDSYIDSVENDAIYIRRGRWQRQNSDEEILGVLKFEDGALKFVHN